MHRDSILFLLLMGLAVFGTTVATGSVDSKEAQLISGFLDVGFASSTEKNSNKGFLINDGAIYAHKVLNEFEMKLDVPFRMYSAGSASFELALFKGQAWVGHRLGESWHWRVGQFDTAFGLEGNDTVDDVFTRQGSVYYFTDPFVHTGFQLGGNIAEDFGFLFYLANPNDRGILSGTSLQTGLRFSGKVGLFRYSIGTLVSTRLSDISENHYVDSTLGFNLGPLKVDLEFNFARRPTNVHPMLGTVVPIQAWLAQLLYSLSETATLGVRAEVVMGAAMVDPRGPATQTILERQVQIFVGPQIQLTPDVTLKTDLSFQEDLPFQSGASPWWVGFNGGITARL